jgi:hypothetical protein
MSTASTEPMKLAPPEMMLPQWLYHQIISDPTAKAVWCHCNAPAVSYCNGLQFVCHGGGHWGVPMKALKPRPEEQVFLEEQCAKGRERWRQETEAEETKRQSRRRKGTRR